MAAMMRLGGEGFKPIQLDSLASQSGASPFQEAGQRLAVGVGLAVECDLALDRPPVGQVNVVNSGTVQT
jgi:hypothetical protein